MKGRKHWHIILLIWVVIRVVSVQNSIYLQIIWHTINNSTAVILSTRNISIKDIVWIWNLFYFTMMHLFIILNNWANWYLQCLITVVSTVHHTIFFNYPVSNAKKLIIKEVILFAIFDNIFISPYQPSKLSTTYTDQSNLSIISTYHHSDRSSKASIRRPRITILV